MKLAYAISVFIVVLLLVMSGIALNSKRCILLNSTRNTFRYIIVGAGPSGLQCAYFLQKFNIPYVILEKAHSPGSFFTKYPVHGTLISINKVYTGSEEKEFNLRHDWNSLLSDDDTLLFKHYSQEYFPKRKLYAKYLNDFYHKLKLHVHFDTKVEEIRKNEEKNTFIINTNKGKYESAFLIDATGYGRVKPIAHLFKGTYLEDKIINYNDLSMDKTMFRNKRVMIVGVGNSGFETADYLNDVVATIAMVGPVPQHSWQTHYVGDVRAINSKFFDTYQLKSLNQMYTLKIKDNEHARNFFK